MNLYTVTYKKYNADVSVVATTPLKAIEGAKAVMKKSYHSTNEILSVAKVQIIDRVVK